MADKFPDIPGTQVGIRGPVSVVDPATQGILSGETQRQKEDATLRRTIAMEQEALANSRKIGTSTQARG